MVVEKKGIKLVDSEPKMEFDSNDRISELPDLVIHSILSLLPRKDAVRTSVLSKHWNRVWDTFPDLYFDQFVYTGIQVTAPELSPEFVRRIGGFLDIVKRSLLRAARRGVVGIKFTLKASVFDDPGLSSDLNRCFELALRSRAASIQVLNASPPGGAAAVPEIASVSDCSCRCSSLRELTLFGVRLSEKSLDDIFLSCPNVRTLGLLSVTGFEKLDVHDLDQLDTLCVNPNSVLSVDIADAPRLRCLRFVACLPGTTCTLNLTSCRGLRELFLLGLGITDELVRSLTTLCPVLEDLTVYNCDMLRKVAVLGKHLARLVLCDCNGIEAVEVDAPALVSFKHQGKALPRFSFKSVPSQSEVVHVIASHVPITTWRFVDLRKFLAVNDLSGCLTVIVCPCQVVFDREELSQAVVPPVVQLQHLKLELKFEDPSFDKQDLVDGLLWSFHPRTISVFSDMMPHSCVEVFSESLLEMEENPTCCGSSGVKCWRHGLKSARAESFDGESGPNDPVVRFELEWDDDSIW